MATHQTSKRVYNKHACDQKDKALVLSSTGPFMLKAYLIHRGVKIAKESDVVIGYWDGSLSARYACAIL